MALPNKKIFSAYSDESGCFRERYQAIGIVSGGKENLETLNSELKKILNNKRTSEIKFEEVRTHRPKVEAAELFLNRAIEFARHKKIRIDVLLWDTRDSRHDIFGRDDIANLERMYYKVLKHISKRWNQTEWKLCPDRNSAINWSEIQSYLNKTKMLRRKSPNLLLLFEEKTYKINFLKIDQRNSQTEPLIQLADLFAGMARFCREKGKECIKWLKDKNNSQGYLFDFNDDSTKEDPSKTNQNRFKLIGDFNDKCKKFKFGVSLNTREFLTTPNPENPINFWNYETQHEDDKAPVRQQGRK